MFEIILFYLVQIYYSFSRAKKSEGRYKEAYKLAFKALQICRSDEKAVKYALKLKQKAQQQEAEEEEDYWEEHY